MVPLAIAPLVIFPLGADTSFTESMSEEGGVGDGEPPTVPFAGIAGEAVTCGGGV